MSTGAEFERIKGQGAIQKAEAIGRLGHAAAGVGSELLGHQAEIRKKEQKRANEVANLEWSNKLDLWENEALYSDGGAFRKLGKDAQGLPESVGGAFDEVANEIATGLSNTDQRMLFSRERSQRYQQLNARLMRYTHEQQQVFEAKELQSHTANKLQAAVANSNDPRAVGLEIAAGEEALRKSLPRLGSGPEAVDEQLRAFRSQALEGVIMQQLALDKPKAAAAYFEEAQGSTTFDEKSITRITNALKIGKTAKEGKTKAAEIIRAGGTLEERRAKAAEIDDSDVSDDVMRRIEHENAITKMQDREEERAILGNAYLLIDKMPDVDRLSPEMKASLGEHLPAIRAYAEKRRMKEPKETDWELYYNKVRQSAKDPAAFAKLNLFTMKGKLDDPEFKELTRIQAAIESGDAAKPDPVRDGVLTNTQIINSTLEHWGLNPNPKSGTPEAKAISQLQRLLTRSIETQQAEQVDAAGKPTGKRRKVTDVEIQDTLDHILGQGEKVEGSWWSTFWRGTTWTPDGGFKRDPTIGGAMKRLVDTTIEQVPPATRKDLEGRLRRRNMPVSDQSILDAYIESKAW